MQTGDLTSFGHKNPKDRRPFSMLQVFFLYIGRPIIKIAPRKLTHLRKTLISWNPPSPNCYKLIFDGAVSAKGKSSGGFIIKDYNGIAVIA